MARKCVTGCSNRTFREDILLLLNCIADNCGNTDPVVYTLATTADCCGQETCLTADGTSVACFTTHEQALFTQAAPILPTPTQAVVPVVWNGTEYALAIANSDTTLADFLAISTNTDTGSFYVLNQGHLCAPDHGMSVGQWYALSTTSAGDLVLESTLNPSIDRIQRVLYVVSDDCVYVNLDQSYIKTPNPCISLDPGNIIMLDEDGCLYAPATALCLAADDNLAVLDGDGCLLVSCEAVQDCVGAAMDAARGLSYDDAADEYSAAISPDAGNQLSQLPNGMYVPAGSGDTVLYIEVAQVGHGYGALAVPFPVYYSSGTADYQLAQADSTTTAADAVCIDASDPDVLVLQNHGPLGPNAHGLTVGKWYVVDPDNAGVAIPKDSLVAGDYIQYLFFVDNTNYLMISVEPMDGLDCPPIQECVATGMDPSRGLDYDAGTDEFTVSVSADTTNEVSLEADGLYVTPGALYPSRETLLFDDFATGRFTDGVVGSLGWAVATSGAGSQIVGDVVGTTHPGVVRLDKGTTSTGYATIFLAATNFVFGGGEITAEALIYLSTLPDVTDAYHLRIGFGDSASGDFTDGAYFTASEATANWQYRTAAGAVRTAANSATAFAAGFAKLKIVVNAAATSVEFFINDASVGTLATDIPSGSSQPTGFVFQIIATAGTASRSLMVDYFKFYQSLTTVR